MLIEKLFLKDPSIKRHLAKTFTWRMLGTIDTIILAWFVTGKLNIGITVGAYELVTKMLLYYLHERIWFKINLGLPGRRENRKQKDVRSNNVNVQPFKITKTHRNRKNKHASFVIWLTGLSGAGKSTLANGIEQTLFKQGVKCYALDGDNVRLGINKDLSFTAEGRKENIRRVAEIAKLMTDAGIVVIASLISPLQEDREMAKNIIGAENFVEIFVECPLEICESRDAKGLYAKARRGLIKDFTGISSPYENPQHPHLIISTEKSEPWKNVEQVFDYIGKRLQINQEPIVSR